MTTINPTDADNLPEYDNDLQLSPDVVDLMTNPLRQHKLLVDNRRYRELHADDYDWSDDLREQDY